MDKMDEDAARRHAHAAATYTNGRISQLPDSEQAAVLDAVVAIGTSFAQSGLVGHDRATGQALHIVADSILKACEQEDVTRHSYWDDEEERKVS